MADFILENDPRRLRRSALAASPSAGPVDLGSSRHSGFISGSRLQSA